MEKDIKKIEENAVNAYIKELKSALGSMTGMFTDELGFVLPLEAIYRQINFIAENGYTTSENSNENVIDEEKELLKAKVRDLAYAYKHAKYCRDLLTDPEKQEIAREAAENAVRNYKETLCDTLSSLWRLMGWNPDTWKQVYSEVK